MPAAVLLGDEWGDATPLIAEGTGEVRLRWAAEEEEEEPGERGLLGVSLDRPATPTCCMSETYMVPVEEEEDGGSCRAF
jgi:hypothetical protein